MRMRNKKFTKFGSERSGFRLDGGWVMMTVVGSKREGEREAVREREAISEKIIKNVKE